jgi:hypothetical protein
VRVLVLGAGSETAPSGTTGSVVVAAVIPSRTTAPSVFAAVRATVRVSTTEVAVIAAIAVAKATETCAAAEIALAALTLPGALAPAPPAPPGPPTASSAAPDPAIQGAAVVVTPTAIPVVPAIGLQIDVALLRDTKFGANERQQCRGAGGKTHDGGPPVTLAGYHPRPIVEAAIVHELLLAKGPTFSLRGYSNPSILRQDHMNLSFCQGDHSPASGRDRS